MNDILCPVLVQRQCTDALSLVVGLRGDASGENMVERNLGIDDKYASIRCSVGDCAVKGFGEIREGKTTIAVHFGVIQAHECQLGEVPVKSDMYFDIPEEK